jgi:hypothetical protein
MTFLEDLTAHKGGLILLKTELYWYGGRGWDRNPGRICLLMDSVLTPTGGAAPVAAARGDGRAGRGGGSFGGAACLLIDGCPHWVWIAPADVELL